jgi:lipopolysaccharide/colanic/teichoic acid biosynthesis glycosyltransferase
MSVIGPRPQTQRCFDAFPLSSQTEIIKVRPGLSGIGSIIFRDEEDMMYANNDPGKFYDEIVMPYKGSLEDWYVSHQNIASYFSLIGLTIWVVLGFSSGLVWKLFKDLPPPSEELNPWI